MSDLSSCSGFFGCRGSLGRKLFPAPSPLPACSIHQTYSHQGLLSRGSIPFLQGIIGCSSGDSGHQFQQGDTWPPSLVPQPGPFSPSLTCHVLVLIEMLSQEAVFKELKPRLQAPCLPYFVSSSKCDGAVWDFAPSLFLLPPFLLVGGCLDLPGSSLSQFSLLSRL